MFDALVLERPCLSPFALVTAVLDEMKRLAQDASGKIRELVSDAIYARRLSTLERLRDDLAFETRRNLNALKPSATVAELQTTLLEIGRRHWTSWGEAIDTTLRLAEKTGLDIDEGLLVTSAKGWNTLATKAESLLPFLPPDARRDLRATAFLLSTGLARVAKDHPEVAAGLEIEKVFKTPIAKVSPNELLLFGVIEALNVAGIAGGVSDFVSERLALDLWRFFRGEDNGEQAKAAEDAYWSAEACEATTRMKRGETEWVSLDALDTSNHWSKIGGMGLTRGQLERARRFGQDQDEDARRAAETPEDAMASLRYLNLVAGKIRASRGADPMEDWDREKESCEAHRGPAPRFRRDPHGRRDSSRLLRQSSARVVRDGARDEGLRRGRPRA